MVQLNNIKTMEADTIEIKEAAFRIREYAYGKLYGAEDIKPIVKDRLDFAADSHVLLAGVNQEFLSTLRNIDSGAAPYDNEYGLANNPRNLELIRFASSGHIYKHDLLKLK